jgi:uncharacterized protein DUF2637
MVRNEFFNFEWGSSARAPATRQEVICVPGPAERQRAASAAQYILLGSFAAVASGISSQGLTGFARANMALSGPWPYLLFLALDGAAGVCAVLLARRAARGGSSVAPRIAVWGLVGASAAFNFTHAPRRPDAPEAYAMMPVIAAVLFEFCLQETRSRATARPGWRPGALGWLHPAERIRTRLRMATDSALPAGEAIRRVRIESAARSLYRLREELATPCRADGNRVPSRRARKALRRAHAALTRAGFADAAIATEVLRTVQVLTMTTTFAALDYGSADTAHAAVSSLITPGTTPFPGQPGLSARLLADNGSAAVPETIQSRPAPKVSPVPDGAPESETAPQPPQPAADGNPPVPDGTSRDHQMVEAARQIVASAATEGSRLSQAALAERLRGQGWTIANDRLSWLATTIGLGPQRRG